MKTNVGLNSVRSSCGDETSRVKKDGEKQVTKKGPASNLRLYIPKFLGIRTEMVCLARSEGNCHC